MEGAMRRPKARVPGTGNIPEAGMQRPWGRNVPRVFEEQTARGPMWLERIKGSSGVTFQRASWVPVGSGSRIE